MSENELRIPDYAYSWAHVEFLKARSKAWLDFVDLFFVAPDKTVSAERLRDIKHAFNASFQNGGD